MFCSKYKTYKYCTVSKIFHEKIKILLMIHFFLFRFVSILFRFPLYRCPCTDCLLMSALHNSTTKYRVMLDYFPHMSVFHQERTGFDHHWTRILCIYSARVCPFHLVASFKFGNHKSKSSLLLLNFAWTGVFVSEF
jgi:hypothetical protein